MPQRSEPQSAMLPGSVPGGRQMQLNRLKRREFIALLGSGIIAWPFAGWAQTQPRMLRVGIVSSANVRNGPPFVAFDQHLSELGYLEGQNLAVEFIGLEGHIERMDEAMHELVRRQVNVIVAFGPEAALKATMAATATIPIVMVAIDYDPI